jgi:hypothetical protein
MANKLEKAYLVLLFMLIFPSQPVDLGRGIGTEKYQCQPALGPARLALEFPQNSDSTPAYYQRQKKKMSHHKNLGQCKIIMIIGTLTTHQQVTRVALSSSSSSSRISTTLPSREKKKYSNKETYKQ